MKQKIVNLVDLLREGEENAITAKELSKLLGFPVRTITQMINYSRCNGEVILSSDKGYFLPDNIEEVKHFINSMKSRRREIKKATQSAQEYLTREAKQWKEKTAL